MANEYKITLSQELSYVFKLQVLVSVRLTLRNFEKWLVFLTETDT